MITRCKVSKYSGYRTSLCVTYKLLNWVDQRTDGQTPEHVITHRYVWREVQCWTNGGKQCMTHTHTSIMLPSSCSSRCILTRERWTWQLTLLRSSALPPVCKRATAPVVERVAYHRVSSFESKNSSFEFNKSSFESRISSFESKNSSLDIYI